MWQAAEDTAAKPQGFLLRFFGNGKRAWLGQSQKHDQKKNANWLLVASYAVAMTTGVLISYMQYFLMCTKKVNFQLWKKETRISRLHEIRCLELILRSSWKYNSSIF